MIQQRFEQTICAPATIPGTGAVSIIRVSGPQAHEIADKVIKLRKGDITSSAGYSLHFGQIFKEDGSLLDEVLVSVFRSPRSYTGEDSVEISCHASRYIVETIIALLVKAGAMPAEAGEFTKRAFLNGKLDLAQAEAVADVIASESSASHSVAVNQLKGHFSSELSVLRDALLKIVSLMELELDFSEEEVEFADRSELAALLDATISHISKLSDSFLTGNAIKNGVPVAIVGSTNTGKSTLLNALLGEERAIVSDIPGTTRDSIEATLQVNGTLLRFIDTAGIRQTSETIEQIGIERTYKKLKEAKIVIGMIDSSLPFERQESDLETILEQVNFDTQHFILVLNKVDLTGKFEINKNVYYKNNFVKYPIIQASAQNKIGLDELKVEIDKYCQKCLSTNDSTLVTNARHYHALLAAGEALERVKVSLQLSVPTDLLTQDIREALHHLGSITGSVTTDEILGNIFKNFCIGK